MAFDGSPLGIWEHVFSFCIQQLKQTMNPTKIAALILKLYRCIKECM